MTIDVPNSSSSRSVNPQVSTPPIQAEVMQIEVVQVPMEMKQPPNPEIKRDYPPFSDTMSSRMFREVVGMFAPLRLSGSSAVRHASASVDDALTHNMNMAVKVAGRVTQMVPKSVNALESGRVFINRHGIQQDGDRHYIAVDVPHLGDGALALRQRNACKDSSDSFDALMDNFEIACSETMTGNCGELAVIACKYLMEEGASSVDYIELRDGKTNNNIIPHAFAVIGRPDDNDYTDVLGFDKNFKGAVIIGLPDSWGDAAVICDPWSRNAYPAKSYNDFWDVLKKSSESPDDLTCTLLARLTKVD